MPKRGSKKRKVTICGAIFILAAVATILAYLEVPSPIRLLFPSSLTTMTTAFSTSPTLTLATGVRTQTTRKDFDLTVTITPEHGWMLDPVGQRWAILPKGKSTSFTMQIKNTGNLAVDVWGLVVTVEFLPTSLERINMTFTVYEQRILKQNEEAVFMWVFGTNIDRPQHTHGVELTFKVRVLQLDKEIKVLGRFTQ